MWKTATGHSANTHGLVCLTLTCRWDFTTRIPQHSRGPQWDSQWVAWDEINPSVFYETTPPTHTHAHTNTVSQCPTSRLLIGQRSSALHVSGQSQYVYYVTVCESPNTHTHWNTLILQIIAKGVWYENRLCHPSLIFLFSYTGASTTKVLFFFFLLFSTLFSPNIKVASVFFEALIVFPIIKLSGPQSTRRICEVVTCFSYRHEPVYTSILQ